MPVQLRLLTKAAAPTSITPVPDGYLVGERAGKVRLLRSQGGDWSFASRPVLDVEADTSTAGNQGLLAVAADRGGARLFVARTTGTGNIVVERYPVAGGVARTAEVRRLLDLPMPYNDHNGGALRFVRGGSLWFSLGDGGGIDDPGRRAQEPDDPRGKVLALDPDGREEPKVLAVGLRNPWRFSIDTVGGDLWLADVGQETAEEIDRVPLDQVDGANFGWSGYEGAILQHPGRAPASSVAPVMQLLHARGYCAVIGGYVYRGRAIPELRGWYLFTDLCRHDLFALQVRGDRVVGQRKLPTGVGSVVAIEPDTAGEPLVLSLDGAIYRVVPA
ncbi:MAG: PQQ-dependent sugar dehydrogenase [Acidimicrobiales bacterium]